MPTFEYRCRSCRRDFEFLVRGADEAVCPDCGSRESDKLLSAPLGHVSGQSGSLPFASCPPSDAPPCRPGCCRIP